MCAYRDEVPTVRIADGNLVMAWSNGDQHCMPLRIARATNAAVRLVLDEHDRGNVLHFPAKPRKRRSRGPDRDSVA
jgi:hypothetical protein